MPCLQKKEMTALILLIVLLAYLCCPSIFLLSKMIEIKEHNKNPSPGI